MEDGQAAFTLKEFEKAFESGRFFQNYHLTAFNYFMAISGGAAALLLSSITSVMVALIYSLLFTAVSIIFFLYNKRIEKHMTEYYLLSRELASDLSMSRLLKAQDKLQHRRIGFGILIRAMYSTSIISWFCMAVYYSAKLLKFL